MYVKCLHWALAVMAVFLVGSSVATGALAFTAGGRCRRCPQGWAWSREHCYYLCSRALDWEASRDSAQATTRPCPAEEHPVCPICKEDFQNCFRKRYSLPRS